MLLIECKENFEYRIYNFADTKDKQRFFSLGFFIGAKIKIVKKKSNMFVVFVSNTMYAINANLAKRVIVK